MRPGPHQPPTHRSREDTPPWHDRPRPRSRPSLTNSSPPPRLEELDIVHDGHQSADTHNLHEEAVANIRLLIRTWGPPGVGGPVPGRGDRAEHLRRLLPGPGSEVAES